MSEAQTANPVAVVQMQLEKMEGEFHKALPAHIPVERFTRVVMTAIRNNNDLLNCNRRSLWNSAMKAAQDGLLPDGREGAIVSYKGEAQWMPMVAGIRKKVRNSGEISTWEVHAVYENDAFEFELGDDPFIKHKPALSNRGKLIAVYSIATLKGGEKSRDVMSVDEVEAIRAISRSKNGPWANPTFYPEMAKKTVARRHSKMLPMSTDLDDLIRRDDELYDMQGASDAEVKAPARSSVGDRLAAIAKAPAHVQPVIEAEAVSPEPAQERAEETPHDPETGEVSPDAEKPASAPPSAPESDPSAEAYARGRKAFARGMKGDAFPPDMKDEAPREAWANGWKDARDEAEA